MFTADCLPVMLVADGAVAALHGGWRGLAGGIVAEGVAALRELGADGPAHAPRSARRARGCCYEVGEEVHAAFADYDARVGERNLDLAAVARAQLEAAGRRGGPRRRAVHDVPDPELFFSHRARRRRHRAPGGGRMAGMITGLEAETVRAATERVRAEIADAAQRPAATRPRSSCSPP